MMIAASVPISRGQEQPQPSQPAGALAGLKADVLPEAQRKALSGMVDADLHRRLRAANDRSTAAWRKVKTRADWQRFRQAALKALAESLGDFAPVPGKLDVRTTGKLQGDGCAIDNLVFASRQGLWVTANLYRPARPPKAMPCILICHSHHSPKHQSELQDMGMTWARAGCLVLIMDQLGHGERRQHPFRSAADFPKPFRVGRQDYYFRYDTGIQLHLVGQGLMGWMARDLMRGVDVLLSQPGADAKRVILLGAVAGGGDPAAVTAALDERITAAVPFNFGGPQPETRLPLPEDAEARFNYAGGGSFESTRNLRRSAADGFLPWVIVAAAAPRGLIYAHEFAWDRDRDPVWKRLEAVYGLYSAGDLLAFAHGRGNLQGRLPQASHCNNVGRVHREMIHPVLKRWFGIDVGPQDEYSQPRPAEDLLCMTPQVERKLHPRRLCDLLGDLADAEIAAARKRLAAQPPAQRVKRLREDWARLLGDVASRGEPKARTIEGAPEKILGAKVERVALDVEPGIVVPVLLLVPQRPEGKRPVVVAVAWGGKAAFLSKRGEEIAALLAGGSAVCLSDVRGTGETLGSGSRGRYSEDVDMSSTELMLGGTMVAARLRDLRSVLAWLRSRGDLDAARVALWGDSFAPVNAAGTDFRVPRHMDGRPEESEPLGGLLALLAGLFEDEVRAVYVRNGLADFRSVLADQFVQIPHDVVIPGVLTAGDLPDVAAALAPRALRLDAPIDGLNRRLSIEAARTLYAPAAESYRAAGEAQRFVVSKTAREPARWMLEQLGGK